MVFYTYLKAKYSDVPFYDQMKEVVEDAVAKKYDQEQGRI